MRLAAADDERHHADAGSARNGEPAALVVQAPVRTGQRLRQGDQHPGRQVVVVVAPQRFEGLGRGAGQLRRGAGELRHHEQAALGARLGADGRLVEEDHVMGIGRPLLSGR